MLPQVLRPTRYNTPVASLILDGLGLCCFNRGRREWQVAFIRPAHRLRIGVQLTTLEGRIVRAWEPVELPVNLEDIRFIVGNPSEAHFDEFLDGFFKATPDFPHGARKTMDDSYDYRWVIDFPAEVPHGPFRKLLRRSERPGGLPITVVRIPNALFYTARVTSDPVLLAPIPKTPDDLESFNFGRTNEEVGAGVYATSTASGAIGLVDRDGNPVRGLPFPLSYVAGHLYEISILNMDVRSKLDSETKRLVGDYVRGDLHRYYEIAEVDDPKHYLYAPRAPRAIDGDCHLVGGGHNGGSVSDLNRLLEP